jgi:gingipain R
MKQLLLTILFISSALIINAQDIRLYIVKGEGSNKPVYTITNSDKGIDIDLSLESFTSQTVTNNNVVFEKILLDDGINVMDKNQPDIQHLSLSINIPFTGRTVVTIDTAEYIDYPSFNIALSTGDPGLNDTNTANPSLLLSNEFFPDEVVKLDRPYIWADNRGQAIHFFPIRYNTVTKVLRVYHHLKVSINTLNEPGENELIRFSPSVNSPLNKLAVTHFSNEPVNSAASNRYTAIDEQGSMLIISHPDFIDQMKAFADWKIQKGIPCEIVDVTTIGDNSKIKEFVSNYYYSKGLTYLLLVGDDAFVPTMQATKGASDNMYGYISGDDHYPEVLVGRFSCETAEQCRIMVERTVNYEKSPSLNAEYNRFLGIGSSLGPGDDNELDFEHIRNIGNVISLVYSKQNELYDGSRGGNDLNGNPTASLTAEEINKGQGMIMYLGHGTVNSWLTSGFSTINARDLQNTDTHPFIWSAGCDNGGFTGTTCLAESFLRAEKDGKPTGAIAVLMSSANQTWYPPMEAQDEIGLIISGKRTTNNSSTFGGISMSGCMRMNDKYNEGAFIITDNWILFGDPSLELRTSKVKKFKPSHDTIIGLDAAQFTITGIDSGAFVCLSAKGVILASMSTITGGTALNLSSLAGLDEMTLTITGKNYEPYISKIKITALPAIAVNPFPINNSYKVSVHTPFKWDMVNGSVPSTVTFSIRKSGNSLWETYPVTSTGQFTVSELEYMTSYEWKVTSSNYADVSESPVFNFQTIDPPDEDFEQEGFPRSNWLNEQDWFVDNSESWEGNYSLHSGINSETSSLFYECQTQSCDYISFMVKMNAQTPGTKLGFYIDNFLIAEWNYTMDWRNITYPVEQGNHILEWRFTSTVDTLTNASSAWLDNIYLPVNNPVTIESMSQETCPEKAIQLQASVSNYASLLWETTGTGRFDDATRLDAIYYPSDEDLASETILLNLEVNSNGICDPEQYVYELSIRQLPVLSGLRDTTLYLNESFEVPIADNVSNMYLYYGTDTNASSLVIDPSKLNTGSNTITVVAENEMGCTTQNQFKVFVINTIRPNTSTLTIFPNPSSDNIIIDDPSFKEDVSFGSAAIISIYNAEGILIDKYPVDKLNGKVLPIGQLNPGMYIIRSEYNGTISSGKFIKI